MAKSCVVGATGRLGKVVVDTLRARGDDVVSNDYDLLNYLIFAHRYRGDPSFELEMAANVTAVVRRIDASTFPYNQDRAVVLVSSIDAVGPNVAQSLSYNVSKAALNQIARYYAKAGHIRINTVSPGTFTTDTPSVTKQQVADVIAFLCSPAASGINGQDIRVDCGASR